MKTLYVLVVLLNSQWMNDGRKMLVIPDHMVMPYTYTTKEECLTVRDNMRRRRVAFAAEWLKMKRHQLIKDSATGTLVATNVMNVRCSSVKLMLR